MGKTAATKKESDETLIALMMVREPSAFSAFYLKYVSLVAGVAYRLTGSNSVLDDIVQETFIDAFKSLDKIRDTEKLKSWLVKIAARKSKQYFSRKYRRQALARDFRQYTEDTAVTEQQDFDEIYDALDRLPDRLRVPWVLHRVEEMTLPEVAEVCDRSLATVKRDIAKAASKIRRYLDDTRY